MSTLSITSTHTMTYCAIAAASGFGIAEKLASVAGTLFRAVHEIGSVSNAPAFRAQA